jgi:rhodanese-related sulfurtransferase
MTTTEARTELDTAAVRGLVADNPDVLLVDVRNPGEYETAHIAGSVNLPLDQVDAHLRRIVSDAGGRLVLVCQSGRRAELAGQKLRGAGMHDVSVLAGGMNAWIAAGAPVERHAPARWSMERQVRFVAGGLTLTAILASIRFPAVRFLAGAVGLGLTVAAVTDSCAMGQMLGKLPYNRGPAVDVDAAIARLGASGGARPVGPSRPRAAQR